MGKPVTEGEKRLKKAFEDASIKYKMGVRVGPYEVDFLIHDIVIEVDGYSHLLPEKKVTDKKKEIYLYEKGYHLIRVLSEETKDREFLKNLIKKLDKPVYINHNDPIIQKPFLSLVELRDKIREDDRLQTKKTGKDEMLDWLDKHSNDIPASKNEGD